MACTGNSSSWGFHLWAYSPGRIQGYHLDERHRRGGRREREERIEADIPWFTQKANKGPDKGLGLFMEAAGTLSPEWRRRAPSRSGLRSPGRKVNAESLYGPRDEPEEEREGEREKEWHGVTKLQWARPITLFSKGTFIPWLVHRGKWKTQSHAESAQTLHLFCLYRNQDFFCIPFPWMLCILSSGLGGLWTFYDPLLIKPAQPENLFFLEMFFLYISNLCQPQKMLNRVTFSRSKGAVSYNKGRTY